MGNSFLELLASSFGGLVTFLHVEGWKAGMWKLGGKAWHCLFCVVQGWNFSSRLMMEHCFVVLGVFLPFLHIK